MNATKHPQRATTPVDAQILFSGIGAGYVAGIDIDTWPPIDAVGSPASGSQHDSDIQVPPVAQAKHSTERTAA